jgi:natural product precursor
MITINKLKLTQLSKAELKARELNTLKGGYCFCDDGCSSCPCYEPTPEEKEQGYENNQSSLNTDEYSGIAGDDQVDVGGNNY